MTPYFESNDQGLIWIYTYLVTSCTSSVLRLSFASPATWKGHPCQGRILPLKGDMSPPLDQIQEAWRLLSPGHFPLWCGAFEKENCQKSCDATSLHRVGVWSLNTFPPRKGAAFLQARVFARGFERKSITPNLQLHWLKRLVYLFYEKFTTFEVQPFNPKQFFCWSDRFAEHSWGSFTSTRTLGYEANEWNAGLSHLWRNLPGQKLSLEKVYSRCYRRFSNVTQGSWCPTMASCNKHAGAFCMSSLFQPPAFLAAVVPEKKIIFGSQSPTQTGYRAFSILFEYILYDFTSSLLWIWQTVQEHKSYAAGPY